MKHFFLSTVLFATLCSSCFAEKIVWNGELSSDGTPSQAIPLDLDKKYQIIVSGVINLGKWVEGGVPMDEDAGFEFGGPNGPEHQPVFKSSNEMALDTKKYNPDHTYKSIPFVAKNSKIHFWIDDKDYSDNNGSLKVQVVQLD